jgi:hypothetical protein
MVPVEDEFGKWYRSDIYSPASQANIADADINSTPIFERRRPLARKILNLLTLQ